MCGGSGRSQRLAYMRQEEQRQAAQRAAASAPGTGEVPTAGGATPAPTHSTPAPPPVVPGAPPITGEQANLLRGRRRRDDASTSTILGSRRGVGAGSRNSIATGGFTTSALGGGTSLLGR